MPKCALRRPQYDCMDAGAFAEEIGEISGLARVISILAASHAFLDVFVDQFEFFNELVTAPLISLA